MEDFGFKLKSEAVKVLFCEREFKVPFSKPNWNWTINTEPNHFLPRAQLHDHKRHYYSTCSLTRADRFGLGLSTPYRQSSETRAKLLGFFVLALERIRSF